MDINNELEYLFGKGFKQEWPNDHTYPHLSFRLDVASKHELLQGVYIELGCLKNIWVLGLWCLDINENPTHLKRVEYSRENLEKLLGHFNLE